MSAVQTKKSFPRGWSNNRTRPAAHRSKALPERAYVSVMGPILWVAASGLGSAEWKRTYAGQPEAAGSNLPAPSGATVRNPDPPPEPPVFPAIPGLARYIRGEHLTGFERLKARGIAWKHRPAAFFSGGESIGKCHRLGTTGRDSEAASWRDTGLGCVFQGGSMHGWTPAQSPITLGHEVLKDKQLVTGMSAHGDNGISVNILQWHQEDSSTTSECPIERIPVRATTNHQGELSPQGGLQSGGLVGLELPGLDLSDG
ncbi:hypothetical protein BJY52DRAFT_1220499 [Lactarius psammicola]|nr:hypothetical protein BJY52DRAFT_1220499 [Lactarius psammicola]